MRFVEGEERGGSSSSFFGTSFSCNSIDSRMERWCRFPKPSVDTGAGLERIAAIMQGDRTISTPISFKRLIKAVAKTVKQKYRSRRERRSFRVIADHSRAVAFSPGGWRFFPPTRVAATVLRRFSVARCATPGCWPPSNPTLVEVVARRHRRDG